MSQTHSVEPIEEKNILTGQPWRIFVIEAFLFSLTLILGIATAFRMKEILRVQEVEIPQISIWQFIFHFLLATLFIFLVIRLIGFRKQKGIILKLLFISAVFFGGTLMLSAWVGDIFSLTLMGILIFWWWKWPSILIQDICIVLGMAGVGSVLGLTFTPEIVMIILIIFSIYDFIAVYITKHMVKIAKEMIENRAILGLIIPPDISGFQASLEEIKPGGKFLILGGGDIVFPLLFAVSLLPSGILNSLIVSFFSLIGLLAGFWFFISQKKRQPIPALPPIAFFSIIGYLLTRIL